MKKSDIKQMPEYFERYINLVADTELSDAFAESITRIETLDLGLLERISRKTYEPDKWTVNSIIQHLIDWERILSYRTLVFARRAGIVPQGIEEKTLGENSNADDRKIAEIIEELKIVRCSTKALFDSFDETILMTDGVVYKYEMSVLAMGFNIIGHQIHHFKVIEDKYFSISKSMIKIAETEDEIRKCYAVAAQIRPHFLMENDFLAQVERQREKYDFQIVFLEEIEIKAVGGMHIGEWLAGGKYLEIEDLVTKEGERSKNYGGALFDWIVAYARRENCAQIKLVSSVKRFGAHKFYLQKGMIIEAHYFSLAL